MAIKVWLRVGGKKCLISLLIFLLSAIIGEDIKKLYLPPSHINEFFSYQFFDSLDVPPPAHFGRWVQDPGPQINMYDDQRT